MVFALMKAVGHAVPKDRRLEASEALIPVARRYFLSSITATEAIRLAREEVRRFELTPAHTDQ